MKTITSIYKNQKFNIKVDNEDYEFISKFSWHLSPDNLKKPNNFYAYTNIRKNDGTRGRISMSRLIMNQNYKNGMEIDHKNHDTLDNRKINLRICSKTLNRLNRKPTKHSSKYKGVSWYPKYNKWASRINKNGKTIFLGYFEKEIDAAKKYDEVVKNYHGEYACENL